MLAVLEREAEAFNKTSCSLGAQSQDLGCIFWCERIMSGRKNPRPGTEQQVQPRKNIKDTVRQKLYSSKVIEMIPKRSN